MLAITQLRWRVLKKTSANGFSKSFQAPWKKKAPESALVSINTINLSTSIPTKVRACAFSYTLLICFPSHHHPLGFSQRAKRKKRGKKKKV